MMEKPWLQLFAEGEGGQTGGETTTICSLLRKKPLRRCAPL